MYHLGINLSHDTSFALSRDEELLFAIEEERFSKIKHNLDKDSLMPGYLCLFYPFRGLNRLFSHPKISPSMISTVTVSVTGESDVHGTWHSKL